MIKFKELIHKKTNISINYSDWLKSYEQNGDIRYCGNRVELYPSNNENEIFKYNPPCKFIIKTKEALFSDEFEVIY